MALVTIQPTAADKTIANAIACRTTPALEEAARFLTWGADEKIVLALAVGAWLYAARRPTLQPAANHVLLVSLLSSVLPHLLKRAVNQTRPDRLTVEGHWRGVPLSGRSRDAFPSGHAMHMARLPRQPVSLHSRSAESRAGWPWSCQSRALCSSRIGRAMSSPDLRWARFWSVSSAR